MKMIVFTLFMMLATVAFSLEGNIQFKGKGHLNNGGEQKEYKVSVELSRSDTGETVMTENYYFSEDHQKQLSFTLVPSDREGCFQVQKEGEAIGKGCCRVVPERGIKECQMALDAGEIKARRRMVFNKEQKTLVRSGVTRKQDQTIFWRDRLRAVPAE